MTLLLVASAAALLFDPGIVHSQDPRSEDFFETRIRPVLAETCFRCHGGLKVSAELRVDSREALLKGGSSGAAIDLESPAESLLIQAVRREEGVAAMPPDRKLEARQSDDLLAWIGAGAPWPKSVPRFESQQHWAFVPVRRPPVPEVKQPDWARNDLDRFILARLEVGQLVPAKEADRRVLLRRVTYSLTGLPPTPQEVHEFEKDSSPKAYEAVVDRLLASPRYGEHWGRHWLDVVRYADTAGENSDHPLPHAWRYRNWVIQSLNRDLPYDEFVREQIAGDLLAPAAPPEQFADHVVATGYLAIARRFGHDIDKDIHLTHEDAIDNLGKTFLGLSLGCCRCHDHKYDPLTARDYYGLYGILDSTRFSFPGCEPKQQPRDLVTLLPEAEIERVLMPTETRLAVLDTRLKQLADEQAGSSQQLKAKQAPVAQVLSAGEIEDSAASNLPATGETISVAVRPGEVLQLSITPRGNHGADSTLVELEIAAADGKQTWSLQDLVASRLAQNPQADKFGNRDVWCFLDTRDGPAYLTEFNEKVESRDSLIAWRSGDVPSVFVNASDQPISVWTNLPARSFFMHPGPAGPVAVAWISPIEGTVSIRGRVADAHPFGDGVGWKLEHFAAPEIGPDLAALGSFRSQMAELRKEQSALQNLRATLPVAYAVAEGTAHNARIHKRGEPADLGDEVPRKFPEVLGGQSVADLKSSGRRELAQWLTSRDNPLAARVMVNRVWQWHFGQGLVTTPNDFGTRGVTPTHPELLDYLADEFVTSNWSLKALHRQILLSSTWRQASESTELSGQYAGFKRRRLTAEELRDTLLAVAGDLDLAPGEAHPFPPEASWNFSQHAPFAADYDSPKRSVYLMQKRNRRNRFLTLFDGPDPNSSTPTRDVTTVPTQALFFLNDPALHVRAEGFANRIVAAADDDRSRLDFAYEVLSGRLATAAEHADAAEFLRDYAKLSSAENIPVQPQAVWSAYARILLSSNEVLYVD